ncbi:ATP-dependent DNA helicase [Candidatus Woesearchaeota archaeon]|nr:ATP-dependent DNA helicase [Candidatus Woesearchaeota archaeon]
MEGDDFLFPFEKIRDEQSSMLEDVSRCLKEKKHMLIHAPTGIGKTVATLGPALKFALERGKTVFFLTPRHTQHRIAIDTLKAIKEKYDLEFYAVDFIGKQWMCSVPGVENFVSGQFQEFCMKQVQSRKCEFYLNTKKSEGTGTVAAENLMKDIEKIGPCHSDKIIELCKEKKLCAYELSALLGKKAKVIIADYFHLLHPTIRQHFLNRNEKHLASSILIIDEGHNLPGRVRDLMTSNLTSFVIGAALKEAEKFDYKETVQIIEAIKDVVDEFCDDIPEEEGEEDRTREKLVDKETFIANVEAKTSSDYEQLIADLEFIADDIREQKERSFVGVVASFLESWKGDDFGFVRILKKKKDRIELSYRCLDPSLITTPMITESHSTIVMSGTLEPLDMYNDLLGFPENTELKCYKSPFDVENRLAMIIPKTTTKYNERSPEMYNEIATILADITNLVPGNSALFFPSYFIRDRVYEFFLNQSKKTTFLEEPEMTKRDKQELIEKYKEYADTGAVLLGAVSGSFSEGIDLPGDFLKCVVVVGIPLSVPDLETNKLIEYYDKKYSKGWDYGYSLPAMSRCLQGAGRCIRTETDKGVIAFLDRRFTWGNYHKVFPKDMNLKITQLYLDRIKEFFGVSD